MEINKLRTLIRESIQEYIKEIDEAAETAAMEARIAKCDEAIATRETKLNAIAESDHKDLMDEGKIKGLENEIKELKKAKAKFEKIAEKKAAKKAKKSAPKEEEVVTDAVTEEAPIDETDVMAEMDVEETAINESFLRMQKLAGVITEAQYNKKKRLIESQLNEEEGPSITDISEKIVQYLKSNNYKSLVFVDGKNTEGKVGDPFELTVNSKTESIKIVGRANDPKIIEKEMKQLQDWILKNFDSLKLLSSFKPGHMGGDQHNGTFSVQIDPSKKSVNEAEEKSIDAFGPQLINRLKAGGFDDVKFTTNSNDADKLAIEAKKEDKNLAVVEYLPQAKFIRITTNKNNQDKAFDIVNSSFLKNLLPDDFVINKQGSYFIELQGK